MWFKVLRHALLVSLLLLLLGSLSEGVNWGNVQICALFALGS